MVGKTVYKIVSINLRNTKEKALCDLFARTSTVLQCSIVFCSYTPIYSLTQVGGTPSLSSSPEFYLYDPLPLTIIKKNSSIFLVTETMCYLFPTKDSSQGCLFAFYGKQGKHKKTPNGKRSNVAPRRSGLVFVSY